jgi:cytochrome c553
MAGQSAFAIYKQLHDFKNGARVNELMASVVQGLDDEQMADVAAHFAALTKGALDPGTISSGGPDIVGLVERGLSARASRLHFLPGAHAGGPVETPTLAGQRQDYLLAQLNAFAKADRHNDIYNRMRGITGKLRQDAAPARPARPTFRKAPRSRSQHYPHHVNKQLYTPPRDAWFSYVGRKNCLSLT